jgi:serine/threonine-protein kinase
VGDYVIGARIARGGCGSVHDAQHVHLGRRAAVKVLHPGLAEQPKMVERFLREVELVNRLRHPAIVEIYDVGVLADLRPYYAMEYLAGGTLDDLLQRRGRLAPDAALTVLEPVCQALAAAHAAGVVHRDVKASNIAFGDAYERVKLLDFGIAKLLGPEPGEPGLTSFGKRLGTPAIMAPEQIKGCAVDARADVYALGVLLYRMLTGGAPFTGGSPGVLARQHLEEPAPRPSRVVPLSPAIDAVVLRCMAKAPGDRFPSATSVHAALAEAVGLSRGIELGPASTPGRGVAVALVLDARTDDDDLDDALANDLADALDLAEEQLRAGSFRLARVTSSSVLGVRALPADAGEEREARRTALALAAALVGAIAARPTADPRVRVTVAVHAGEASVRPGAPDGDVSVVGGPLLAASSWVPRVPGSGFVATPAAVEGLGPLDLPAGVPLEIAVPPPR